MRRCEKERAFYCYNVFFFYFSCNSMFVKTKLWILSRGWSRLLVTNICRNMVLTYVFVFGILNSFNSIRILWSFRSTPNSFGLLGCGFNRFCVWLFSLLKYAWISWLPKSLVLEFSVRLCARVVFLFKIMFIWKLHFHSHNRRRIIILRII